MLQPCTQDSVRKKGVGKAKKGNSKNKEQKLYKQASCTDVLFNQMETTNSYKLLSAIGKLNQSATLLKGIESYICNHRA